MGRARTRVVRIIVAMIVGVLLLPLQGRAAQSNEATNETQHRGACGDTEVESAAVARPTLALRRDAVEDADDAAPTHVCVVSDALPAGVMVLVAPTMLESLMRADRPRARAPP